MKLSQTPLIGFHSTAWMPGRFLHRCAPPARDVGRRLKQEDALRERRGGPIVRAGPGAPRGFQMPSCDGRPLASFQIETISLNPLIQPHTHLIPPCPLKQTPGWSFTPVCESRGSLRPEMSQNRSEDRDFSRFNHQVELFRLFSPLLIQLEMNDHQKKSPPPPHFK